jgi:hypothetical protein
MELPYVYRKFILASKHRNMGSKPIPTWMTILDTQDACGSLPC